MSNIAFWTASHLPDLGGFQWSTYRLAKALTKLGHKTIFVTRSTHNKEFEPDTPVVRFDGDTVLEWTHTSGEWLVANRKHFDLIHSIDFFYKAVDEQLEFLSVIGLPSLIKIPTQGYVQKLIDTPTKRNRIREISAFSALNQGIAVELEQLGITSEHIHLIPNGVDSSEFVPTANCAKLRKQLNLPDNKILLLFIGRMVYRKRLDVLLSAMKLVPNTVMLVMVGSAFGQRDSVEAEIVEKVSTLPNVMLRPPTTDVLPYYQSCDINVLLSEREGMPNSVLEGMSCGMPTIVSNIPGMVEVVDSEKNGIVVPVGDTMATVVAINRLAKDAKFRECLGQAARQKITMKFDINKIAMAYDELYQTLTQRKKLLS
jgi:glycosyltransferase involved in cell wall biosynthesis